MGLEKYKENLLKISGERLDKILCPEFLLHFPEASVKLTIDNFMCELTTCGGPFPSLPLQTAPRNTLDKILLISVASIGINLFYHGSKQQIKAPL
jgi:hypothetical protein